MKSTCLLLIMIILNSLHVNAQSVSINVNYPQPHSSRFEDYIGNYNSVIFITLTNVTQAPVSLKLKGVLNGTNGVQISTRNNYQPALPIQLAAFETKVLTPSEIGLFFNENAIEYSGIDRNQILFTRLIPEGNYDYCVLAYDYNTPGYEINNLLSDPNGTSFCTDFNIEYIEPPIIQSVGNQFCGETIPDDMITGVLPNQFLSINWMYPIGANLQTQYRVTLVEVNPLSRDVNDAFNAGRSTYLYENTVTTNFVIIDNSAPKLKQGMLYAFKVTAINPTQGFRNNGVSEICSFFYGTAPLNTGSNNLSIRQVYPADGATIPFNYFPVIIKYEPYNDDINRFTTNYQISAGSIPLENNRRVLNWPQGPLLTQRALTFPDLTQDQSQHISVNKTNAALKPELYFVRGKSYNFSVTAEALLASTGNNLRGELNGRFKVGMPVPNLNFPLNDTLLSPGNVELFFNTGNTQEGLLPPFPIVQATHNNGVSMFNGTVNERVFVQVAKKNNFEQGTIIDTFSVAVGRNFDLATENESLIKNEIYRDIRHTLNVSDTGKYYWRAVWLNNPNGSDVSSFYNKSATGSFRIGATVADSTPPPRPTPSECLANCEAPAVTDQTAVSTLNIGQGVRLGNFVMTITSLSNASSPFMGVGTIPVPFLGAQIRVNFSNLRVNASMMAISGNAVAINDVPGVIPAELANTLGEFAGLTDGKAQEINELVSTSSRLVSIIQGSNPVIGLPLGLDNTIDGVRTTIAIVGMTFNTTTANLNAVANIAIPEMNGWLSLGAKNICFHPRGINVNEGILFNPSDKRLAYSPDIEFVLKGANASSSDSGTYVSWDCAGFKELQLEGEFRFGRNLLVPDNLNGTIGLDTVKATFSVKVTKSFGWMLALNMDPFQFTGLPEWGFVPSQLIFDYSSTSNFSGMPFPERYVGDKSSTWKGFYLKQFQVRLPQAFRNTSNDSRISFSANDVLIDRTGFTGVLLAQNIVNYNNCNIDGWGLGIDSVSLEIVSNSFVSSKLSGNLKLPIAAAPVAYRMILNRNSVGQFGYLCNIAPRDTMNITIIDPAKLSIQPTSHILISKQPNAGFVVVGLLNASMTISGDYEGIGPVQFPGIHVQNFRIENRAPYVSCQALSFASPSKSVAGIPVNIDDIRFEYASEPELLEFDRSPGPRVALSFGVSLRLLNSSNVFRANTRIKFISKVSSSSTGPLFVSFSGITASKVDISGTIGPVQLTGGLEFYAGNATYGDGIRGYIDAVFAPAVALQAIVQFGNKDSHYYFYADASAQFTPTIPLLPGMKLKGFGGAVYYGMTLANLPPCDNIPTGRISELSSLGSTATGAVVTPNVNAGFGFAARMFVVSEVQGAYLGMLEAGASFSSSGGLSMINIGGKVMAMSTSTNYNEAKLKAIANITLDFDRTIFDGRFEAFVNVNEVLKGANANNSAGIIHFYFDTTTWFIHVGNPTERIALKVNLGVQLDADAYLMLGMNLPPAPPLPSEITNLMALSSGGLPPPMLRDPRVANQSGFAFGTSIDVNVPKQNFLIFYAQLRLILGFDVAVVHSPEVTCTNTGNGQRGADGWYTEGQLYGYFSGEIGIHVDVWFVQGDIPILSVQVASSLMGGFPNPNFVRGNLAGNYNILGGLIQGHCYFEVNVGQKCSGNEQDVLNGFDLVSEMTPNNGGTDIDCFVAPQVVFNIQPGKIDTISYVNPSEVRVTKTYRVLYKEFMLSGGGLVVKQTLFNGNMQNAVLEKSTDGHVFAMRPLEGLKPNTTYTLSITAYIEELENGVWKMSKNRSNNDVSKTYTRIFTTGAFPTVLSDNLVSTTYPQRGQRFFLQEECRNGVINTRVNVSQIFNQNTPGVTSQFFVEFTPLDGSSAPTRTPYNASGVSNQIRFNIPQLQNNKAYAMRIIRLSNFANAPAASNSNKNQSGTSNPILNAQVNQNLGNGSTVQINNYSALTSSSKYEEVVYIYYFKTSIYNTLREKMANVRNVRATELRLFEEQAGDGMLRQLSFRFNLDEGFDVYDAIGEVFIQPGTTNALTTTQANVRFTQIASAQDQLHRKTLVYDKYDRAVSTQVLNSSFPYLSMTLPTPTTPYSLQDNYVAQLTNYLPALTRDQFINPAGSGSGPFFPIGGISIPVPTIILNYSGYLDAHRAKTRLANALTELNSNALFLPTYLTRSTPADRTSYQNTIFVRRFTGYPVCQDVLFNAGFIPRNGCLNTGISQSLVPGNSGNSTITVIYPPCGPGTN